MHRASCLKYVRRESTSCQRSDVHTLLVDLPIDVLYLVLGQVDEQHCLRTFNFAHFTCRALHEAANLYEQQRHARTVLDPICCSRVSHWRDVCLSGGGLARLSGKCGLVTMSGLCHARGVHITKAVVKGTVTLEGCIIEHAITILPGASLRLHHCLIRCAGPDVPVRACPNAALIEAVDCSFRSCRSGYQTTPPHHIKADDCQAVKLIRCTFHGEVGSAQVAVKPTAKACLNVESCSFEAAIFRSASEKRRGAKRPPATSDGTRVGLCLLHGDLPPVVDLAHNSFLGRSLVISNQRSKSTIMCRHNTFVDSQIKANGQGLHIRLIGSPGKSAIEPGQGSRISMHRKDGTLLASIFLFLGEYRVASPLSCPVLHEGKPPLQAQVVHLG